MSDPHPTPGASPDVLQFDTAEPSAPQAAGLTCAACSSGIRTVYHQVAGKTVCSPCRAHLEAGPRGSMGKALLLGTGAGIVGWAIYYAILAKFNYELALIAILVGFGVGRGVNMGSAGRGGRAYQVLAVAITYLAITATYAPLIVAEFGKESPVTAATWVVAELVALAYPFLSATTSPIGLIILAVGLWEAWRVNQRVPLEFTGPHPVAQADPLAPAEPALA